MSIPGKLIPAALKTLRAEPATESYPTERRDLPERFRGAVEFEADPCTGCGMCERHCAADAISVDVDDEGIVTWQYDVSRCMFCGQCADSCPTGAITMGREFELASADRAEFEEAHTFER